MKKLEKRAIDAFHNMWEEWSVLSRENFDKALTFWGDNLQGFGTAIHEIWRGKEDLRKYGEMWLGQSDTSMKVETKWIEAKTLKQPFVAVWGEIIIHVFTSHKHIIIDPVRTTAVFEDQGKDVLLVQWHSSEPDVSTEEDLWPGTAAPKRYEEVSILFTDFVGFTHTVNMIPAKKLVGELNQIFAGFDKILIERGVKKVKTIGDAYMAVCGLDGEKDHAVTIVHVAKAMMSFLDSRNQESALKWQMRAGVHSGPVVGGVIGSENLSFDLWGNTVNMAHRMESASEAGKINISAFTYDMIRHKIRCTYRGKLSIKEKSKMDMYFVD